MHSVRSFAAAAVLTAAAACLSGCGGGSTATVSGAVTYEGQPVGDGYITFTPADGKGQDAGAKIADGRYTVIGLPPGPKVVKVMAVKKVNFASTSAEMQQKAAVARKGGDHGGLVDPADTIPNDAEGNNATVELTAGNQTRDFNLKKPAKKGR
nr:hypothetical protein [uncultured bacterium]